MVTAEEPPKNNTWETAHRCIFLQLVYIHRGGSCGCFAITACTECAHYTRECARDVLIRNSFFDAFSKGADGVLIGGCHPGDCHYMEGNYKALRRVQLLKRMLKQMNIEEHRFPS